MKNDEVKLLVGTGEIKRFENYITWKNKQGEFNTECNRASLENDIALTIPTQSQTKVAIEREVV